MVVQAGRQVWAPKGRGLPERRLAKAEGRGDGMAVDVTEAHFEAFDRYICGEFAKCCGVRDVLVGGLDGFPERRSYELRQALSESEGLAEGVLRVEGGGA